MIDKPLNVDLTTYHFSPNIFSNIFLTYPAYPTLSTMCTITA